MVYEIRFTRTFNYFDNIAFTFGAKRLPGLAKSLGKSTKNLNLHLKRIIKKSF